MRLRSSSTSLSFSVSACTAGDAAGESEIAEDAVEIDGVRAQLELVGLERVALRLGLRWLLDGRLFDDGLNDGLQDRLLLCLRLDGRLEQLRIAGEQEIGAREWRLATQPAGNQRVRVGLAAQLERTPEPLDVRVVPRLACHEVLGDE